MFVLMSGHIEDDYNELLPCAHCGGPAIFWLFQSQSRDYWQVDCQKCGVKSAQAHTKEAAMKTWNARELAIKQLPLIN